MATVSQNGDLIMWSIPVTNNAAYTDTNVVVTDVSTAGTSYVSHTVTKGTFNPTTGVWTIGDLEAKKTETLKLTVRVVDISLAPFVNTASVTGTLIDNNIGDNTFTQTVPAAICAPAGGVAPSFSSCLCGDLSRITTKCTQGVTEWRLIASSVVNGINQYWNTQDGTFGFTPIDPTLPVTFAYDLFCVKGAEEYQISCAVPYTITPQLVNKSVFDHIVSQVKITDLTVADIAVLQAQYPNLTVADYCWQVIKNANGVVTSGIPLDCDPTVDNRTFVICTAVPCTNTPCPDCPILTLPADVQAQILVDTPGYVPEKGDVVFIQHPNATSVYTYNGSGWVKSSCGCVYKISQDADNDLILSTDNAPFFDLTTEPELIALQNKVLTAAAITGTANKVLTLTFQDGTTLTAPFTDIDTDTTYTISIAGNVISLTHSSGPAQTITLPVGAADNWGTQVIQHAVGSSSSGDGTIASPLLVPVPSVVTDGTITGNGTIASPLAVNPFNNRIIAEAYTASVVLPTTATEALITTNAGFETTTHLVYDTVNNRITNVSGYALVLRVDYSAYFRYSATVPPGTIKSFGIFAYKNGTTLLDGLTVEYMIKEDSYNWGSIAKSDYVQLGNNDYIVLKYIADNPLSLNQLTILAEQVAVAI